MRCKAQTKGGARCKASAIVGSSMCIFHETKQSSKRMERYYKKSMRRYELKRKKK
jgi:uncharacterized protein YecT (DUF1311 family)